MHAILLLVGLLAPTLAVGVEFGNRYLSFLLPSGWTCSQQETEFVCVPPLAEGEQAPTIMILTAKVAGPDDTLSHYQRHLAGDERPGPVAAVTAPQLVEIDGVVWVDATLNGSEIQNYNTRYLATTKNGLAVLFTFSAHHSTYDRLVGAAIQAVHTLRLKQDWERPSSNRQE